MNERIVKGCKDMGDAKNEFALSDLRAKLNGCLLLLNFGFSWWLQDRKREIQHHIEKSVTPKTASRDPSFRLVPLVEIHKFRR